MKRIIRNLRIFVASIFLEIGHKVDATDIEDVVAEMRRLDPDYEKSGEPPLLPKQTKQRIKGAEEN